MRTTEAVRERPIPFSAPMIRAILDGRKTQARRVVKPQPGGGFRSFGKLPTCDCHPFGFHDGERHYPCPYGQPGDRLWVKEKWASPEANKAQPGRVAYDADGVCGAYLGDGAGGLIFIHHGRILEASGYRECFPESGDQTYGLGKYTDVRSGRYPSYRYGWRPSIHMPRWASRITLEIVGVRVERLHDITEADALAEGCDGDCPVGYYPAHASAPCVYHFAQVWESINGKTHPWESNPWVWVIEFRRPEAPR